MDGEGDELISHEEAEAFPGVRASDYIESASNKVFGVTMEGSIGLFPSKTQIGDRVVLFAGGTMPYLLRPASPSQRSSYLLRTPCLRRNGVVYHLVGPCYVYGLTDTDERAKHSSSHHEILLF